MASQMLRHAIDINPNQARQCMNSHGLPTFTNKRLSWDCAEVKDVLHPFASRSRFRNSTTCTYRTRDQPHAAQYNARNHNMGPPPPWDVAAQAFSSATSGNMCGNVKRLKCCTHCTTSGSRVTAELSGGMCKQQKVWLGEPNRKHQENHGLHRSR